VQLVPIGMLTVGCKKTPIITNMLSITSSSILMISFSENVFVESDGFFFCFFLDQCHPKTRDMDKYYNIHEGRPWPQLYNCTICRFHLHGQPVTMTAEFVTYIAARGLIDKACQ
jgi:hypothetical protein